MSAGCHLSVFQRGVLVVIDRKPRGAKPHPTGLIPSPDDVHQTLPPIIILLTRIANVIHNKYVDADGADYAEIRYWTSAESAKSASEILNQIEWCDFIGTLQAFQIANAINFKWQAWPALFVRATLAGKCGIKS